VSDGNSSRIPTRRDQSHFLDGQCLVDGPDGVDNSGFARFGFAGFNGFVVQTDRPFPGIRDNPLNYCVTLATIFHWEPTARNSDSSLKIIAFLGERFATREEKTGHRRPPDRRELKSGFSFGLHAGQPSCALMTLGFAGAGFMAYRHKRQDGSQRRVLACFDP
jgi:hypothetical protein